jgi:hypothetical protein
MEVEADRLMSFIAIRRNSKRKTRVTIIASAVTQGHVPRAFSLKQKLAGTAVRNAQYLILTLKLPLLSL